MSAATLKGSYDQENELASRWRLGVSGALLLGWVLFLSWVAWVS